MQAEIDQWENSVNAVVQSEVQFSHPFDVV